jgi:hypothetical protein
MERDGGRLDLVEEDSGEEMLAGVLLHVIEAAVPGDFSFDGGAGGEGFTDEVPDFAAFVFFDGFDGNIEGSAAARGGAEEAGIKRLASAGGIKRGAVESKLPDGLTLGAREFADVGDGGGKGLQERVSVVEPLRPGHAVLLLIWRNAIRAPGQIDRRPGAASFSLVEDGRRAW